jgi:hypothetical protein
VPVDWAGWLTIDDKLRNRSFVEVRFQMAPGGKTAG